VDGGRIRAIECFGYDCLPTELTKIFTSLRLAMNAKNGLYDILREFMNENENLK